MSFLKPHFFQCAFLIGAVFLVTDSATAKLVRDKKKEMQRSIENGTGKIKGVFDRGFYVSPEKTFLFQVPPLGEKDFSIYDSTDGTELLVSFKNPEQSYQIDVYRTKGKKTAEEYFDFENGGKNAKKHHFIFKGILEEKFDLWKSPQEVEVFIAIDRAEGLLGADLNTTAGYAYFMVNDVVYRVITMKNWDGFPHKTDTFKKMPDAELIEKGKQNILETLSRLWVHPRETVQSKPEASSTLADQALTSAK